MKGTWAWGLLLAAVIGVLIWMWRPSHTAVPLESAHKAANADALRAARRVLPKALENVYLGMDLDSLRKARPKAHLNPEAEEEQYLVYDEPLTGASRAVYFVRRLGFSLAKVQVAAQFRGVEGIQARVAMNAARYGAPNGIWDCPDRGADYLATRRFTWQMQGIGVMDVYLIIGETVSATLYVAPAGAILESLRAAGCVPTQSDGLTQFPVPQATVPRGQ